MAPIWQLVVSGRAYRMAVDETYVRWFETLGSGDVGIVGGKNASLGEMIPTVKNKGIRMVHHVAQAEKTLFRKAG